MYVIFNKVLLFVQVHWRSFRLQKYCILLAPLIRIVQKTNFARSSAWPENAGHTPTCPTELVDNFVNLVWDVFLDLIPLRAAATSAKVTRMHVFILQDFTMSCTLLARTIPTVKILGSINHMLVACLFHHQRRIAHTQCGSHHGRLAPQSMFLSVAEPKEPPPPPEVVYPFCKSHEDCEDRQFCGTQCWTGNCGINGRARPGTRGKFCQPCDKCQRRRDSVDRSCEVCKLTSKTRVCVCVCMCVFALVIDSMPAFRPRYNQQRRVLRMGPVPTAVTVRARTFAR